LPQLEYDGAELRKELQSLPLHYLFREQARLTKLQVETKYSLKFVNEELESRKSSEAASAAENVSVSTQDVRHNESKLKCPWCSEKAIFVKKCKDGSHWYKCKRTHFWSPDALSKDSVADFQSGGIPLAEKMDKYKTIRDRNCASCGNPWFFDKGSALECTTCQFEFKPPTIVDI